MNKRQRKKRDKADAEARECIDWLRRLHNAERLFMGFVWVPVAMPDGEIVHVVRARVAETERVVESEG